MLPWKLTSCYPRYFMIMILALIFYHFCLHTMKLIAASPYQLKDSLIMTTKKPQNERSHKRKRCFFEDELLKKLDTSLSHKLVKHTSIWNLNSFVGTKPRDILKSILQRYKHPLAFFNIVNFFARTLKQLKQIMNIIYVRFCDILHHFL